MVPVDSPLTRRSLLASGVLLASVACDAGARPSPAPSPEPGTEALRIVPQQRPAPLVAEGSRVAWLADGALQVADLSGSPLARIAVPSPRGLAVLPDRALVLVDLAQSGRMRARSWYDWAVGSDADADAAAGNPLSAAAELFVLPAGEAGELWLLSWDPPTGISLVRLGAGTPRLSLLGSVTPGARDSRAVAAGPDGALLTALSGALLSRSKDLQAEPGKQALPRSIATPLHLAVGAAGSLWVSQARQRVLYRLVGGSDGLEIAAQSMPLPGDVHHLAAGPVGAVALVVDQEVATGSATWTLVCVDSAGQERWRQILPGLTRPSGAFVAMSARVVAVLDGDTLRLWEAESGRQLPLPG